MVAKGAGMDPSAAELIKNQIASTHWNSVELGFGSPSAHDPRHLENKQHTHV